jgi:hypothetical protein
MLVSNSIVLGERFPSLWQFISSNSKLKASTPIKWLAGQQYSILSKYLGHKPIAKSYYSHLLRNFYFIIVKIERTPTATKSVMANMPSTSWCSSNICFAKIYSFLKSNIFTGVHQLWIKRDVVFSRLFYIQ